MVYQIVALVVSYILIFSTGMALGMLITCGKVSRETILPQKPSQTQKNTPNPAPHNNNVVYMTDSREDDFLAKITEDQKYG